MKFFKSLFINISTVIFINTQDSKSVLKKILIDWYNFIEINTALK